MWLSPLVLRSTLLLKVIQLKWWSSWTNPLQRTSQLLLLPWTSPPQVSKPTVHAVNELYLYWNPIGRIAYILWVLCMCSDCFFLPPQILMTTLVAPLTCPSQLDQLRWHSMWVLCETTLWNYSSTSRQHSACRVHQKDALLALQICPTSPFRMTHVCWD